MQCIFCGGQINTIRGRLEHNAKGLGTIIIPETEYEECEKCGRCGEITKDEVYIPNSKNA